MLLPLPTPTPVRLLPLPGPVPIVMFEVLFPGKRAVVRMAAGPVAGTVPATFAPRFISLMLLLPSKIIYIFHVVQAGEGDDPCEMWQA